MIKSRYNRFLLSIITITGLTISTYLTARDTSATREIKASVYVTEKQASDATPKGPPPKSVGSDDLRSQRSLKNPVVGPKWTHVAEQYDNLNPQSPFKSEPSKPLQSKITLKQQSARIPIQSQPPIVFTPPAEAAHSEIALEQQQIQRASHSRPDLAFTPRAEAAHSEIALEQQQIQRASHSRPDLAFTPPAEAAHSEIALEQQQIQRASHSRPDLAFTPPAEAAHSEIALEQHQAHRAVNSQPSPRFSLIEPDQQIATIPPAPSITTAGLESAKAYYIDDEDTNRSDPRLKPKVGVSVPKTQARLSGTSDLGKTKVAISQTFENEASFVAQHFIRPPQQHTAEESEEEPPLEEIAQAPPPPPPTEKIPSTEPVKSITAQENPTQHLLEQEAYINFNNVAFIQYLNFISRLTGKNFVFDEADLDFRVTIISNKPTTIEFVMSALLQELRIHNLSLMEVGNTLIIHRNNTVNSPGTILGSNDQIPPGVELITQVFSLGNTPPSAMVLILQPMLSSLALIETNDTTNHLIVTDIAPNVKKAAELIERLDTPFTGYEIGQYIVKNASLDAVTQLVEKLMSPIAGNASISFIPHQPTNSIFIVGSRFLVERALAILEKVDSQEATTRILSVESSKPTKVLAPSEAATTRKVLSQESVDFLYDFLQSLTRDDLIKFLNQNESQLRNNPDFLRALQNLQLTNAQKARILNEAIDFLHNLSAEDRKKLETNNLKNFLHAEGIGVSGPPVHPKENELKTELQENYDYLTPEERSFILNANQALDQVQLGEPRTKLNDESDFFNNQLDNEIGKYRPEEARQIRKGSWQSTLPIGHIESTEFTVVALQYRNGEEIVKALTNMANSLATDILTDSTELIASINSVQYIKSSNSLLLTGTRRSLAKVKDIVAQIDTPVRQVLIEVLLLQTTIDDSLNYGVNFGSRFDGFSSVGGQTFSDSGGSNFVQALNAVTGNGGTPVPTSGYSWLSNSFNLGVIGRNVRKGPFVFDTIGALIEALHTDTVTEVLMNPKIVVEDNATAEVFVGENTAYATDVVTFGQTGSNNNTQQSIEFRDIGTSLKVTPRIGTNNIITLSIEQEVSNEKTGGTSGGGGGSSGTGSTGVTTTQISGVGPTTTKSSTKTIIHMPDGYFLILSGMIQTSRVATNTQVPCLGGIPGLGGAFRSRANQDARNNLIIFIRPSIIEVQNINEQTKRQQDIMRHKSQPTDRYDNEVDTALQFLNLEEEPNFIR